MKNLKRLTIAICLIASSSQGSNGWPVLDALVGMPTDWQDRNEGHRARSERLRPWAKAIEHVSSSAGDTAALLALIEHESMAAKRIQFDQCGSNECDGGKAKGLLQIQKNACTDALKIWSMPPTDERFVIEAKCALEVYWAAQKKCKGSNRRGATDGLSGYRGKCKTSDGILRTNTFLTMLDVVKNGWPDAPAGWIRNGKPSLKNRRDALERVKNLQAQPGDFIPLGDGDGALVEWHFHDFGGDVRPRGWHKGLSLYYYK